MNNCTKNELSLSELLHQLRNLTKLHSITIVRCHFPAFGNYSLDWMTNVRNINLACNNLNMKETIKFLGQQQSLSQLDTLVLDRCKKVNIPINLDNYLLDANLFCNLSFSSSLRRWSFQRTGHYIYDAALPRCVPNLRSISLGHNSYFDILNDGVYISDKKPEKTILNSFKSLYYIKASYLMSSTPTEETQCNADDIIFDRYFIDESQFDNKPCQPAQIDPISYYQSITLPSCLRSIQLDHYTLNSELNYLSPMSIRFSPNNSLESLDLSNTIIMIDGLSINAVSLSGLHKLRIAKFRHMNIKRMYMLTINQANNLQELDLSDNRLELMTANQLSKILTKSLGIHKLNLSSCNIGELNSDFLLQFPHLKMLDLSYNKLFHLSLNLSYLLTQDHLTIDLSFNQISTVNYSFVNSVQEAERVRPMTLKLDNNKFRCDCDNIAFLKWFQSTNSSVENKKTITCDYRGTSTVNIVSVVVSDLEFQCTKYMRIIYIALSSVLGIATISLIFGVLLFKYRWHFRWHWYHAKFKFRRLLNKNGYKAVEEQLDYVCYLNYFGVTDEWVMRQMIPRIENWNIGGVFVFERDAECGKFIGDVIIETIDRSRKLLYVIGNDADAGEMKSFHTSLELSCIARLNDIIIVYRDLITFESLQQRMPLLKSLCRPGRRHPLKIIQFEANEDLCWTELQHCISDAKTADEEINEACVCTCKCKKCSKLIRL